jgi:hypothetical protein
MRGMELFTGVGRGRLGMRGMPIKPSGPEQSCPIVWTPPCGGAQELKARNIQTTPVRVEPFGCRPGQALRTGQGRDT